MKLLTSLIISLAVANPSIDSRPEWETIVLGPRRSLTLPGNQKGECLRLWNHLLGVDLIHISEGERIRPLPGDYLCESVDSPDLAQTHAAFIYACGEVQGLSLKWFQDGKGGHWKELRAKCLEAALLYRAQLTELLTDSKDSVAMHDPRVLLDFAISRWRHSPEEALEYIQLLLQQVPDLKMAQEMEVIAYAFLWCRALRHGYPVTEAREHFESAMEKLQNFHPDSSVLDQPWKEMITQVVKEPSVEFDLPLELLVK